MLQIEAVSETIEFMIIVYKYWIIKILIKTNT